MKGVITFFLLALISCPLHSLEKYSDIFKLSLEELLNLRVEVASKKKEYLTDAPSILSVVTAEEIKSYGAKNLLEVLGKVTSIQPTGSNFFPNNVANVRSATLTHSANHILILINGLFFMVQMLLQGLLILSPRQKRPLKKRRYRCPQDLFQHIVSMH